MNHNDDFNSNNLSFLIEEDNQNNSNEEDLQKMLMEFNNMDDEYYFFQENIDSNQQELSYYIKKNQLKDCMEFFYEEYKVKDLLKICEYYNIDKDIKQLKCKKTEIISTIIMFEGLPENKIVVENRHRMWAYMEELLKDSYMRKYLFWN
jgi:hypothetical protein